MTAAAVLVALVACGTLPLSAQFDLRPSLADARSGAIEVAVRAGDAGDVTLRVPPEDEACQRLEDERYGATIEMARLDYEIDVAYDGPALRGLVEIQPYLSPDAATLWNGANALGDAVLIDLGAGSTTIVETVRLTGTQLGAVNERHVCAGIELRARHVAAVEDGVAVLAYEVRRLRLGIGFSLF
jgi:hypothetical protein